MSANSADYSSYYLEYGHVSYPELIYAPRKKAWLLLFAPGLILSGISYIADGIPALTDASFVLLAIVCLLLIAEELLNFSRRFGMGGITLLIGVLLWFCHDYLSNWFWLNFNDGGATVLPNGAVVTPYVLAKATFLHQLFVLCAVGGLHVPMWQRLERWLASLPEPRSDGFYMPLILLCFAIGMIPYVFFATGSPVSAIWADITGGRGGGAGFTVGRTGNVNESWGAYLAQLQQIGQVGAILALFYLMLLKPNIVFKGICLCIWLLYVGLAFGTGARGHTAYMAMPALFVLFLKYQSQAAEMFRKFSMKAYIWCGVAAFVLLVAIQIQITFRNVGFNDIKIAEVKSGLEGNAMLSEGLNGMSLIPEQYPFFMNRFPGQGAVLCLPDVGWRFLYGPIPRALWPGKPIDPLWAWYNSVVTGRPEQELEGTTVATGLVGDFYFRFGIAGVIEGGLLFGYLCLLGERMLQNSQGRLLQLVAAIGFLVFMFRSFRGLTFINLYPLMIGVGFLTILIKITGARPQQPAYLPQQ
jgi:hypothetical protein